MPKQAGVPSQIAELSRQQQQNFERDYLRDSARDPRVRRAGRTEYALGWRGHFDAVSAHSRRRKAPGECRIQPHCKCSCHLNKITLENPMHLITDPATGERMTLGAYIDLTADFDD
jgi:hypothetical protein